MAEPHYWEAWQPKIGDRVRVRLSPERRCAHLTEDDGQLAVVVSTMPREECLALLHYDDGHYYGVEFDETTALNRDFGLPHWFASMQPTPDTWFAAIELEPLINREPAR